MNKVLRILSLVMIMVVFAACSSKDDKIDFNKLSNEEKIALLDARIKENPKMLHCISNVQQSFTKWAIQRKLCLT